MKSLAADPVTLAYHELRAPLGLVATAARSAAADCEDEELRKRCEIIVRAAERMLSTAQSVLSLAEGSLPAESERVLLGSVVQRLAEEACALGVPACLTTGDDPGMMVDVPVSQLETLLQSLLNNAQQHGSDLPGEVIALAVHREGNCGVVEIKNRISSSVRHKGIGAGTYLANRIAAQFGGMIESSNDGEFYTASLIIPLCENDR